MGFLGCFGFLFGFAGSGFAWFGFPLGFGFLSGLLGFSFLGFGFLALHF